MATASSVLRFDRVHKHFGRTQAVRDVSFDVRGGEIVALLGENGAGKSTLIKILAGIYKADSGTVELNGQLVAGTALGRNPDIAFIHQDLGLIDWMTVAENINFNGQLAGPTGIISWRRLRRRAREALARVNCQVHPDERVFNLSRTDRSLIAIARALMTNCRILVLDEPTSSLPTVEVERLFKVLKQLRDEGVGMIYVSHRLAEIPRIADRVIVMRDGVLAGQGKASELSTADLVQMIVGHESKNLARAEVHPDATALLELDQLEVSDVGPVSLTLRRGEVLALTGLQGAGHTDVGRTIFGLMPDYAGRIILQGKKANMKSPAVAIGCGIGFTSSKRHEESLASNMTIVENLLLNPHIVGKRSLSLNTPAQERKVASQLIDAFTIRPRNGAEIIETLSGGNQQKVVLARWFHCDPDVLILEEPTLGVDVGSRAEIYSGLFSLLAAGKGIVLISSDFEEVSLVANRALVMREGRVTHELEGDDITVASLNDFAAG